MRNFELRSESPAGNRWRTKSDEDLARALQNNLNSAYPPYAPSLPREYQPRTYRCTSLSFPVVVPESFITSQDDLFSCIVRSFSFFLNCLKFLIGLLEQIF